MTIALDVGAVSALAGPAGGALVRALVETARWPPTIPSAVLVESLRGHGPRDARAIVVATAEALAAPVLTGDLADIRALAAHATGVVAVGV